MEGVSHVPELDGSQALPQRAMQPADEESAQRKPRVRIPNVKGEIVGDVALRQAAQLIAPLRQERQPFFLGFRV